MSRKYLLALVASLLLLDLGMQPRAVYADPAQVYVCWSPCQEPNIIGPVSFEGNYVPQVLANEWPGAARSQSLYAGAITIRTFAQRPADGCGAIAFYKNSLPVENNISQRYWYGNDPTTGQAPIQQRHFAAVNATAGKEIIRASDGQLACAKYFANVGNPTAQGGELPTLASIPDPVYSGGAGTVPGMGQNGTYAWTLNTAGQQATRWTWQHILSHY
jgi:peptidoglycan hydrolase-like amidase